jgi:peptide/nickel transport system ATP-binding protein
MSDTLSVQNQTEATKLKAAEPEIPLLDVRNLTKRFSVGGLRSQKQVHALNGPSFSLKRQEVVALVGESGSGKSTTARLLARLMQPSQGEIFFKGQDILKTEPRRASLHYRAAVQMIFQDPFGSLNPVHTVSHHLTRPLLIHHKVRNRAESRERVHELLATVGLNPPDVVAQKHPHQLSGGQRQRVAIARVLAADPQLVLADEPISMLDVSIRMGVLNLMERLKEERGISYLYITHDIASARYIGDRIMVMYAGYIVESAESSELTEQPAHPYTQLLLQAVPNPQAGLHKRAIQVRGEIPSLVNPPPGCPFAPRCAKAFSLCRQEMPPPVPLDSNHWVRCHLYTANSADPALS